MRAIYQSVLFWLVISHPIALAQLRSAPHPGRYGTLTGQHPLTQVTPRSHISVHTSPPVRISHDGSSHGLYITGLYSPGLVTVLAVGHSADASHRSVHHSQPNCPKMAEPNLAKYALYIHISAKNGGERSRNKLALVLYMWFHLLGLTASSPNDIR